MKLARQLLQTPELAHFRDVETLPGPQVTSDDETLDFARRFGVSSYHLNSARTWAPRAIRFQSWTINYACTAWTDCGSRIHR